MLDGAAQHHHVLHLQQQLLAAQAQVAHLFGPGGLQQAQAAIQAHAPLFDCNAPQPHLESVLGLLAALQHIDGRLSTSLYARRSALEAGLRSNQAVRHAAQPGVRKYFRSPSKSHPLVDAIPYSCSFEEAFVVVQHSPRHKISGP